MIKIENTFTKGYLESWETIHKFYINVGNEDDEIDHNRCIGIDTEYAQFLIKKLNNFVNNQKNK